MAVQIYLIANDSLGIIKIGISSEPLKRMQSLQCASGCKLRLIKSASPIGKALSVERELHDHFASHRTFGEWFSITEEEALNAFDNAVRNRKPNSKKVPVWLSKKHYKFRRLGSRK